MEPDPTTDVQVRMRCEEGDYAEAASVVIRRYGSEIMGLLATLGPDDATAADAYSLFCERVWRALSSFRFEASTRTWAYVLARRALVDACRAKRRGPALVPMSPSQLPDVVERARSTTRPYLQTAHKHRLRALREAMPADDQWLLVLRIDRELPWTEIAKIMSEGEATDDELRRTAAALRKRYQRAKARLTEQLSAEKATGEPG